jgi:hypothetical protein
MRLFCIITIVLCSSFYSCSVSQNNEVVPEIRVKINNVREADKLLLSDYIDSLFIIKLETKPEFLIGTLDKIIFHQDKIFIFDRQSQAIFVYGIDGKYLAHVYAQGKGRGEYFKIADFDIDKIKNLIVIKDNFRNRINYYNYNGEFVRSDRFRHYATSFSIIDEDLWACYNAVNGRLKNKRYQLFFTNRKGKIQTSHLPFEKHFLKDARRLEEALPQCENNFFIDLYGRNIYQIDGANIIPKYQIDFGKNNLPPGHHWYEQDFDYSNYARLSRFSTNNEHLYFNYFIDRETISAYYDISTGKIKKFNSYTVYPNQELPINEGIMWGQTRGVYKNFFVHFKEPYGFAGKKNLSMEEQTFLKKYGLENMNPMDNPILVFKKLKSF